MTGVSESIELLHQLLPGHREKGRPGDSFSDWGKLLRLNRTHGIPGLLLNRLESVAPPEVLKELMERQKKARIRGLWLQRSALDVRALLREGGIQRLAPLKGTHLLPLLYGDYGARTTNDVDLLVGVSEFEKTHELLVSGGYRYIPKPTGRPASQRANYERSYQAPEGHVVDVHRGLCQTSRVQLDYDGIWSRTTRMEDGELHGFDRLDDGDVLLTLLVHIGQDNFQGPFRQWWDVALLLQKGQFDRSLFLRHAQDSGAGTLVWCVFHRLNWLGVDTGPDDWRRLAPRGLRKAYLIQMLEQQALTPVSFEVSARRAQAMTMLPVMDGWWRRTRLLAEYAALRLQDPVQRWRGD